MFRSGAFVARHLDGLTEEGLRPEQVQPNGVDLTLGAVHEQTCPGRIDRDGTSVGDRTAREPEDGVYRLDPGAYVVEYGEPVRIPREHVGFVYPRSSLLRNSCMLNTAVWDAS